MVEAFFVQYEFQAIASKLKDRPLRVQETKQKELLWVQVPPLTFYTYVKVAQRKSDSCND